METAARVKRTVLIATGNAGKLRDFAAAAAPFGVSVARVPNLELIPEPIEDAPTFEANAAKKAEHYSHHVPGQLVLADDSGLCVDALGGSPGVYSARWAAVAVGHPEKPLALLGNTSDAANNAQLLHDLAHAPESERGARFVCSIAAARDGRLVSCFRGQVHGRLLRELRGEQGFGYDPLFLIESLDKTFAELSPEEKARFSHRGQAFRKFLAWYVEQVR